MAALSNKYLEQNNNLLNYYLHALKDYGDLIAMETRRNGSWEGLTYNQLFKKVHLLASFLGSQKLGHGKKIAVMSESCSEYPLAVLSILKAGCIVVPIDYKLSSTEISSILNHCECDAIFVGIHEKDLWNEVQAGLNHQMQSFSLDDENGVHSLCEGQIIHKTYPKRSDDDMALLVYTSGTTGNPKGVMLSLRNILCQMDSISRRYKVFGKRFLSILPLNHLFEFTAGCLFPLSQGATIYYGRSSLPTDIIYFFQEKMITHQFCVPLVLNAFYQSIQRKIEKLPTYKRLILKILMIVSAFIPLNKRKFLFKDIHKAFGNHMEIFMSGGAALNDNVYNFFSRVGLHVSQGYGLSEMSPLVSMNLKDKNKKGSVGVPLEEIEVKIDEEGVIHLRGPNVMLGYYKNPDETKNVISPTGWLNTGDIGYIDKEGFLFITGRKKCLIVLDRGKNIHPEEIESVFSQSSIVRDVMALGRKVEGKEQLSCIIVPTEEYIQKFSHDLQLLEKEVIANLSKLRDRLAAYKWPQHFSVRIDELPKTTTKKIARSKIQI